MRGAGTSSTANPGGSRSDTWSLRTRAESLTGNFRGFFGKL